MTVTKDTVISVRVPHDIKAALSAAAKIERRSLATMVEVMVLAYCKGHSMSLPLAGMVDSGAAKPSRKKPTPPKKS